MKVRNEDILRASEQVRWAIEKYNEILRSVQGTCAHKDVGEAPALTGWHNDRICLECGIKENGRGGFKDLKNSLVYKLNELQVDQLTHRSRSSNGW